MAEFARKKPFLREKNSIWSKQKKTLRSLKPFGTMCFGLETKFNFLATTKDGVFWRKKGEAFVEKNTLPTGMEVDPLCFGVVWQLGEESIPPNIKTF